MEHYKNYRTGELHGEWTWCFQCERVYRTRLWAARHWLCPGCDAGATDAHNWAADTWPRNLNPDYPALPVEGAYYPRHRDSTAH
jgi:hypothetical protein